MPRLLLSLLLFAVPLHAGATERTEELCKMTATIAGSAVEERASGGEQTGAVKAITAGLEDGKSAYAPAVVLIVHWVYTLPEDQLTEEVAQAYEEACLANPDG